MQDENGMKSPHMLALYRERPDIPTETHQDISLRGDSQSGHPTAQGRVLATRHHCKQ
jgi:hypothetical protein